jgi:preprotein translocase subunit SecA
MNRHRKATYAMRHEILRSKDIKKRISIFVDDEVRALATSPLATTDQFEDVLREIFPFEEATLDRLFDTDASKFEKVFLEAAKELYDGRETAFTKEIMRKVERDVYLQVLDNLWMQHLENMDHLREGIHWMSVGQQDPLVEYRRRGQLLFDDMQQTLRHDVLRSLFHAQPISQEELDRATETELTRAARSSIENGSQINTSDSEYDESDFAGTKKVVAPKAKQPVTIKKARKTERKRKTTAKRRKK